MLPFILPLLCWMSAQASEQPRDLESGFEAEAAADSKLVEGIWRTDKLAPGAFSIQGKVVKAGKKAASITVRTGNIPTTGLGGVTAERAEIQIDRPLWTQEGETYEYAFSLFIPKDFPVQTQRSVIGQWKQICPTGDDCKVANPILAQRIKNRKFTITRVGDSGEPEVLYKEGKIDRLLGRWLSFVYKVRFSKASNGVIDVWLDGKKIVNYSGITAYSTRVGYSGTSQFDFRMGIYRDRMSQPATIYFDAFTRKRIQ